MGYGGGTLLTNAFRAIAGVLAPLLSRFAIRQYQRRGAEAGPPSGLADLAPELDEALDVLAAGEGLGALPARAKGILSERPSAFANPMVREWVGNSKARALLKAAALRADQNLDVEAEKTACLEIYAEVTGERAHSGLRYFEDALTFLRLTARSYVSAEGRALLQNANANRDALRAEVIPIAEQVAALPSLLATSSVEALDAFIENALRRVASRRSFREARTLEDLGRLADDVSEGGLQRADVRLRCKVLRETAAEAARCGMLPRAQEHLASAKGLDQSADYGIDDARLALCGGDASGAMRILRDRTDPAATALMIDAVRVRDGVEAAVHHFEDRVRDPAALSGGGLASIALGLSELGRMEDAFALLARAAEDQIEDCGAILHLRVRLAIALCLPEELRPKFGLETWSLPRAKGLSDDAQARDRLSRALADAHALEARVDSLDLPLTARHASQTALWLGLAAREVHDARSAAETRLLDMLLDSESAFVAVPLACEFDIPFDRDAIARRLEDAAALGGWTVDQCASALHLAFGSPQAMAALIEDRRDELTDVFEASFLDALLVEAHVRAGAVDRARAAFDSALSRQSGGDAGELRAVEPILLAAEGGDAVAVQIAAYEEEGRLTALIGLVEVLRGKGDSARLAHYLPILWRQRRRIEDARAAVEALEAIGDEDGKAAFIGELGPEAGADPVLLMHRAWSASRAGDFAAARRALEALDPASDDVNGRALRINIAMETGDWDDLHSVLAEDLAVPGAGRARELLQAANIAQAIGSRRVADLVDAAVAAAPDDPDVLLGAYLTIMRSGDDIDHPDAGAWMRRAAELSGPDGPVQLAAASDLPRILTERREIVRDLSAHVVGGDVALFAAVGRLGLTMTELFAEVMPANADLDVRRRVALPLCAGNRTSTDLRAAQGIALDIGALLLQAQLGILDLVVQTFPTVVIPAGTMPALLRDIGAVRMHQPSRAAEAALILSEAGRGSILALEPDRTDPDLVERAGLNFAQIAATAERSNALILHTPPVYRQGSFMTDEVELGRLASRMVDLPSLVAALAEQGGLDAVGETRILEDLALREAAGRWDEGATPTIDRPLIVDGLALHFLAASGLLPEATRHFGRIFVHPHTLDEARGTATAFQRGERLAGTVEAVRRVLHRSITEGRVRVSIRREALVGERGGRPAADVEIPPLQSLIVDPGPVDAVVVDDRFVNAFPVATDRNETSRPIATTLDVVEALYARGRIDAPRRSTLRYEMRRRGVALMPVDADEIAAAALRGSSRHGSSAELRAIMDSVALPFLRDAVRLPRDAAWFVGVTTAALEATKGVWISAPDVDAASAAAARILTLLPRPGEWAAVYDGAERSVWRENLELQIDAFLIGGLAGGDPERGAAYAAWAEARVALPLRDRDPARFDRLVAYKKGLLLDHLMPEAEGGLIRSARATVSTYLRAVPPTLRTALITDPEIRVAAGLSAHRMISLEGHRIPLEEMFGLARSLVDERPPPLLRDVGGVPVEHVAVLKGGNLEVRAHNATCVLMAAGLASDRPERRLAALDGLLSALSLPINRTVALRTSVSTHMPTVASYLEILDRCEAAPERFLWKLAADLRDGHSLGVDNLVPETRDTLVGMVAAREGSETLQEFLVGPLRAAADAAIARDPVRALRFLAPIPHLENSLVELAAATLSDPSVLDAVGLMAADGDPFGLVCGLALSAGRVDREGFEEAGIILLDRIHGTGEAGEGRFELFSACAVAAYGVIARRRTLADEPRFYRQVVALTYAGHLARTLIATAVDPTSALAAAVNGAGQDALVTGWRDRFEEPSWRPEWLDPTSLSAYIRALAGSIVAAMGARAPASWRRRVADADKAAAGSGELALRLKPGPLAPFERCDGPVRLDPAELPIIIADLSSPADEARSFLAVAYLAEVADGERPALRAAIEGRLKSAASDRIPWDRGIDAALHLAGRWRDQPLADLALDAALSSGALDRAPADGAVRMALDVAAAAGDADGWRSRLKTAAERLAMVDLIPEAADAMAAGLESLAGSSDGLDAELAKARMAAARSSDRHRPRV